MNALKQLWQLVRHDSETSVIAKSRAVEVESVIIQRKQKRILDKAIEQSPFDLAKILDDITRQDRTNE